MSNYFTSIEITDNRYYGVVYDANTNAEVYRTRIYDTQLQASKDANIWATTQTTPESIPLPTANPPGQQTITNTSFFRATPGGGCCGR